MKALMVGVAMATYLVAPLKESPDPSGQCILPSITECRLLPDGNRPHTVERWCAGQGWINVFQTCRSQFGPYS